MKLSRNAISMLVAHYRSIFKKAFSAGLAGVVITSMGVANATDLPKENDAFKITGTDNTYTLTKTDASGGHTYTSFTSEAGSQATFSGSVHHANIVISGDIDINGELTLDGKDNKFVLMQGASGGKYTSTVTLGKESKLNLSGSAIEAKKVVIKGGEHFIGGRVSDGDEWMSTAHLLAYGEGANVTVEGGTITLADSYLNAGGKNASVDLNGGTITMSSTNSSGGQPTFVGTYGSEKGHQVNINGATIVVGNGTTKQYGNIFGENINIKGDSKIDVKASGSLTLDGSLVKKASGSLQVGDKYAGAITMTGGIITNAGALTIGSSNGTTFTATAGTISNTGTIDFSGNATITGNAVIAKQTENGGKYNVHSGTLTISKENLDNALSGTTTKAQVNMKANTTLAITGEGTLDLSNTVDFTGEAKDGKVGFANKGSLNAKDMTATFSGNTLNTNQVDLTVDKLEITRQTADQAVTLSGSITVGSGITLANPTKGVSLYTADTTADDINVSGSLTLGIDGKSGGKLNYDLNLNHTGSKLTVADGSWNIQSVKVDAAVQADALTIASGSSAEIDNLTITSSATTDGFAKVEGDLSVTQSLSNKSGKAIVVDGGGSVSLSEAVIVKDGKVNKDVGTFNVGAGSELELNLGSGATIGSDGFADTDLSGLLASGSVGFINVGDASLDVKVENGFVSYDELKKVMNFSGNFTSDELKTASLHLSKDDDTTTTGIKGSIGNILVDKNNSSSLIDITANGSSNTDNGIAITGDTVLNTPYVFDGNNYYAAITTGETTALKLESALGIQIKNGASLTVGSDGTYGYIGTIVNDTTGQKSGSLVINGDVTVINAGEKASVSNGVATNTSDIGTSTSALDNISVNGKLTAIDVFATTSVINGAVDLSLLSGSSVEFNGNNLSFIETLDVDTITIGSKFEERASASETTVLTNKLSGSASVQNGGTFVFTGADTVYEREDVLAAVNEAKSKFTGITSTLYVDKQLDLSSNKVQVGNVPDSVDSSTGAVFANNSLTILNGESLATTQEAVSGGTVKVDDSSKLYAINFKDGQKLWDTTANPTQINSDGDDTTNGWSFEAGTLTFDNGFLMLNDDGTVAFNEDAGVARYGRATVAELAYITELAKATAGAGQYKDNGTGAYADFNLADLYLQDLMQRFGANGDAVVSHLTSVGRFAQLAGVETAAMAVINSGNNAIAQRLGVAGVESAQLATVNATSGASFWLAPTYSSVDADGFSANAFNYGQDLDLGGVALGADFLSESGVRVGAMFNIGSGSSDSQGDLVYTENDFDYVGFGIYAGAKFGSFGLTADVGYTTISNDVDQRNIENFKADIDSSVVTAGLNGQYTFDLGVVDVIPHVGVRYNRINVDGYDVRYNGQTLMNADDETLNVVQFPIGVTLASEFKTGNLYFKPTLDLSVIPATGDTDADTDVHFISAFSEGNIAYTTEVYDDVAYSANLGLNAAYGNAQFGVVYNYTGSDNTDNHSVSLLGKYLF